MKWQSKQFCLPNKVLLWRYCKVDDFVKKLGVSIAEKRKAAGFTQAGFALQCDIDKQALNRIENGRTSPTIKTLRMIAGQLKILVRDFFDFEAQ